MAAHKKLLHIRKNGISPVNEKFHKRKENKKKEYQNRKIPIPFLCSKKYGGDKRDRTADLLNAIQALSQLSYTPIYELFQVNSSKLLNFYCHFSESLYNNISLGTIVIITQRFLDVNTFFRWRANFFRRFIGGLCRHFQEMNSINS